MWVGKLRTMGKAPDGPEVQQSRDSRCAEKFGLSGGQRPSRPFHRSDKTSREQPSRCGLRGGKWAAYPPGREAAKLSV